MDVRATGRQRLTPDPPALKPTGSPLPRPMQFHLKYPAVNRLGLDYRHFGEPLPLFKRLGGRFFPKNSPFQRRVEKVGLRYVRMLRACSAVDAH